jgi:stage V sporulation protein G
MYADIAHPINTECRQRIQEKVTAAFKEEMGNYKQPDSNSVELDEPEEDVPEIIS